MGGHRRDTSLLLVALFLYGINLGLFLPLAPLIAAKNSSAAVGGLVNTVFLLATVAAQWVSPMLLQYLTRRFFFFGGLALMTLSCVVFGFESTPTWLIFAASVTRGLGFGMVTVVGSALVISLTAPERHGFAVGLVGLATAMSAVFGPPLGLLLYHHFSQAVPTAVGIASGLIAIGLVASVRALRRGGILHGFDALIPRNALLQMVKRSDLRSYAIALALISVAWGGTATFMGLALPGTGLASAVVFLLVSDCMRAVARYVAGWWLDRGVSPVGAGVPFVLLTSCGLAVVAADQRGIAIIVGAVLYGAGLGMLQTMMFFAMMRRNEFGHSATSALWATSLDIGGAAGASALSAVVLVGGYSAVLWTMPAIVVLAAPILFVQWRRERRAPGLLETL